MDEELRNSLLLNRIANRIARMGAWAVELPATTLLWSEEMFALLDMPPGQPPSAEQSLSLYEPASRTRVREAFARCAQSGDPFDLEVRLHTASGKAIWGRLVGERVLGESGGVTRIHGALQDISALKRTEDSLRKLDLAVNQSPSSIVITDLEARIVYANATFEQQTGYHSEEILGQNPRILQSGHTPKATYKEMWDCLVRGESWRGEFHNRRKDGSEYLESVHMSPVRDEADEITHYLAIKEDITEKRAAEERIRDLAHFDQLTGLPNRTLLENRANQSLSRARRHAEPLAVMFLDLDHFKDINDSLGHTVGDELLVAVANRFSDTLRAEDTVARLGGDEFIFILPGADATAATHIAQKLIELVVRPFAIDGYELQTSTSIGIAIYPADGTTLETLLRNADAAMYQVKQHARNDFRFFTQDMQERARRRLDLSSALRQALAANQLSLCYQPQFSACSGEMVGMEALLRWEHPELGLISPAEFIPIAEESGVIREIGEWVLWHAAGQLAEWSMADLPPLRLAVNLSAVQFREQGLPELVQRVLQQYRIPPSQLELELTEAVAMEDPDGARLMIDRLSALGVRISIDDFGTGYSSLSYLKKFRVDKLKIDQSFVADMLSEGEGLQIVIAIITLARALGMHTVAEGVETAQQLELLRELGCDEVQGYYFSRPLRADALLKYFKAQLAGRAGGTPALCEGPTGGTPP